MDKKVLTATVEGIVEDVAKATGLDAGEARALVGIALKKSKTLFVESAKALAGLTVVAPPA